MVRAPASLGPAHCALKPLGGSRAEFLPFHLHKERLGFPGAVGQHLPQRESGREAAKGCGIARWDETRCLVTLYAGKTRTVAMSGCRTGTEEMKGNRETPHWGMLCGRGCWSPSAPPDSGHTKGGKVAPNTLLEAASASEGVELVEKRPGFQ